MSSMLEPQSVPWSQRGGPLRSSSKLSLLGLTPSMWNQSLHFNKTPWQTHHSKVSVAVLRLQPKWNVFREGFF